MIKMKKGQTKITGTKLTAGLFILLAIVGTTYYVADSDTAYHCEANDVVGICFKLSNVNSDGFQTRCYYNESAPTKYKNCKTGWTEWEGKIVGNTIPMEDYEDITKDVQTLSNIKTTLTSINLDSYSVSDYEIGTDEIERCLKRVDSVPYVCFNEESEMNETCYKSMNRINTCKQFKTFWINCIVYEKIEAEDDEYVECLSEENVYYSSQEMIEILDSWEKERMENIANAEISRKNKQSKIKVSEGITIIK